MPVFFLPQFIADLQNHGDANFARRVLQKTLRPDGSFRLNRDDHPYKGIEDAWIRYVSRDSTAYRVIYLQYGSDTYLYRAGEHSIENRLNGPTAGFETTSISVVEARSEIISAIAATPVAPTSPVPALLPPINRLKRNKPLRQIYREILSRRNLPHKDIWLVCPFIDCDLFAQTSAFGKLLFAQIEDGASVVLITAPPKDKKIDWMEKLAERQVDIFVYPRLHTKLYCFVFDEDRRYEPGLLYEKQYSSLILLGSANLTSPGLALESGRCNEELCYAVPDDEIGFIETYVTELMTRGYGLPEVRSYLARGQGQKLERERW